MSYKGVPRYLFVVHFIAVAMVFPGLFKSDYSLYTSYVQMITHVAHSTTILSTISSYLISFIVIDRLNNKDTMRSTNALERVPGVGGLVGHCIVYSTMGSLLIEPIETLTTYSNSRLSRLDIDKYQEI